MTTNQTRPHPFAGSGTRLRTQAVGVAMLLGASHALAADTAAADADPVTPKKSRESSDRQLDDIEVYGAADLSASPKFTAPLLDTPQSVTVIPQSVIQDSAALSLQDALRNVPGITFGAGEGGNPIGDRPSIRGFNSTSNIYVDGMRDIGIQTRDIFDLEQIEVIRGPDSSIAGRSAGGGSINLISKTPHLGNAVELTGTYGTAHQYRGALDANVQLGDGVAARVNLMHNGGGVPGRDSVVRTDKTGVAAAIAVGLNSPTRITFSYYRFADKSTPDYGVPVNLDTGLPYSEDGSISRRNFYGLANRDFRDSVVDIGSARIEHSLGDDFTLRSQLRYTHNQNNYLVTSPDDAAGNTLNGLVYRLPITRLAADNALISQTDLFGHLMTGPVRHDIDIGLELSQERLNQAGDGNYNGYLVNSPAGVQYFGFEDCYLPGDPNYTQRQISHDCTSLYQPNPHDAWSGTVVPNPNHNFYNTRDGAAYAFDTVTLSPHWKLNGGVRWDIYQTSTRAADPAGNADSHLSFASYQVGLIFKPLENGTVYFTTSNASLPQDLAFSDQDQAIASSPFNPSTSGAKPVKTTSYELGTKWNLFASRLLVSGDVFTETTRNAAIQVQPDLYQTIGKTRSRGVELSANGSITETWNVIAGYSLLDAVLKSGSYYDSGVGQQLVDSPRNTFSLFSTAQVQQVVTVGGGAYFRSRQVGYYGPPDRYIPGYWRFDALAKWQVTPQVNLQLNVQNLFDRDYYTKTYYQFALPAAGRTWLLGATAKF